MLPAASRMRRAADFTTTVRRGNRVLVGNVVVSVLLDPGADRAPLVGLIVSRRVGGSVVRHRVSRRLRAAAAAHLGRLPLGSTVVLRALPGAGSSHRLVADASAAIDTAITRALGRPR